MRKLIFKFLRATGARMVVSLHNGDGKGRVFVRLSYKNFDWTDNGMVLKPEIKEKLSKEFSENKEEIVKALDIERIAKEILEEKGR